MEEKKQDGYTEEGRKLRPRRPRISKVSNYSENNNYSERNNDYYSESRSQSSERRPYGSSERFSYNSPNRGYNSNRRGYSSDENRGGYRSERRNYTNPVRNRFNSDDRKGEKSYNSYDSHRENNSRTGYNNDRRPYRQRTEGFEGRPFRPNRYDANNEGRPYRQKTENGEGRPYRSNRYENNNEGRPRWNNNRNAYGSDRRSPSKYASYGRNRGGDNPRFKRNNYNQDFDNAGINKMIHSRPQISNMEYSDNDYIPTPIKEEIRLNKYIANSGICSRREADQFIQAGVVTVNGEVVSELGTKINVSKDEVKFNGEKLKGEEKVYIIMNKPKGFVTTASDPHAEKTVMDLLKTCTYRVFPVGRLDKNTTGVLLFTNDGDIAEKLTHPSYDKKKIYQVILDNPLTQEDFIKIKDGLTLGDGEIQPDDLEYTDTQDHRKIGIEIHSGKNRIVRRIFESLGYDVRALDRVYFAGLTKKGLKKGEWRYLSEGESNLLKMGAYI